MDSFTGRQRELEQLARSAVTAGGVVGVHAIGGMAGVGKTAFAVHAAHQLADRFPGGQLFLSLHGHTPGRIPVDPADALAGLLLSCGVPAAQVPAGLEGRAALWRDQVAARPLLLVLDDAVGSEQVRPLLPGAGGSLVLVTSRRRLSALDDPAVAEIIRLCGYLPLAVGMMARQLRHRGRPVGHMTTAYSHPQALPAGAVSAAGARCRQGRGRKCRHLTTATDPAAAVSLKGARKTGTGGQAQTRRSS